MKTKKQILEENQLLNEDWIENVLMVAGFVPVIGEVADIILILRYCYKKEYLYAGLMLIALIPTVGDFIAKPLIRLLKGAGGVGKLALKNTDEMIKFANSNPAFKKQYLKLGQELDNPMVRKTIDGVSGISTRLGTELQKSVAQHKTVIGKLLSRPVGIVKSVGKEVSAGGKFSTGFKNFFRNEKLAEYVAKKGMEPQTWLSKWYNVVYKGRQARRNFIKNFIMSNKILDMIGLPSFEAFEDKMENDPDFRTQMANNPNFSNMVNQTTTPQDIESIEGGGESESTRSGIGDKMSLSFIKMLAKGIA
jgi:hypothetical protein